MSQEITAKYSIDLDEFFAGMNKVSDTYGRVNDVVTGMRRVDPFAQANTSSTKFNQQLASQVQIYQRVEAAANAFRAEQKRLESQYKDLKSRQLEFIAAGRYGELKAQLSLIKDKLVEMKSPLVEVDSFWDRLKAKFAGGLKVPKIDIPKLPDVGGGSGGGSRKEDKSKGSFLGQAGEAVLDEVGSAAGLQVSGGTLAAGAAVAAVGATVIKGTKEWAEYGEKLSEVSALTGATGKSLQYLDDQAQAIEKDTGIAGVTILEAFKNIAGIKPELLENNEALAQTTKEVIALSQASKLGLDESAKALLGSLSQFNEGADQAGRFANVLAAGAQKGNSEINDTAEALKNSGTAMKAAGLSFEQGNALLQILAKGMIKGAEAGTGLRNILLKLETQSDKNLRPSIVGLDVALENAAKKFNTTTKQTEAFGLENIVAAKQILSARGEVTEMTKALTGTSVAYDQAKTNTDNLATDLNKASTSIDAFFRNLGQSNDGFLRGMVQRFTSFVNEIGSKTSVFKTFMNSYVKNEEDGLIGALFTAGKEANKQRQANLDKAREDARKAGIITASKQSVDDDLAIITKLNKERGEVEATAVRNAAEKVKAQREVNYQDAVADHQRLRKQLEKEIKETGKDSGKLTAQFNASRERLISVTTAKKIADSTVDQINKKATEQATNLASLLNDGPSKEQEKANNKKQQQQDEANRLLLAAQEDYLKESQKLEAQFGKDRLEALKKDSEEYINAKAQLEQDALKIERDAFEKRLQLSKSKKTEVVNGKRQVVANTSVTLENTAPEFARLFNEKQQQIEDERARQVKLSRVRQEYDLLQLAKSGYDNELAIFDKFWEEKLLVEKDNSGKLVELRQQRDDARKKVEKVYSQADLAAFDKAWEEIIANEEKNSAVYNAMVAKRKRDRNTLVFDQFLKQNKEQEQISLDFVDTNEAENTYRRNDPKANATDIERRREKERLAIRISAGENTIKFLEEQGKAENAVQITAARKGLEALKKELDNFDLLNPEKQTIFDLLGLTNGMNDIQTQSLKDSFSAIGQAIQQTTQLIVEQSDTRIQALDAEISAKEEQISVEEERNKEGFANNLSLRKKELEDLKRQKAEEEAVKRKALAVQKSIDAASVISNQVVAISEGIRFLTGYAKTSSVLGPIAGPIAYAAAVGTILASIFAITQQFKSLTKLRDGGRLRGAKHEQGGIPGTGAFSDIEVEGGEHVTNARSSAKYDAALAYLNEDDPKNAIQSLVKQFGFGMPEVVVKHIKQPSFSQPAPMMNTSRLEAELRDQKELTRTLIQHVAALPTSQIVGLADGSVLEKEKGRTTITKPR